MSGGGSSGYVPAKKVNVKVRHPGYFQKEMLSRDHIGQVLGKDGLPPADFQGMPGFGASFAQQLAARPQSERTRGAQWRGVESRYWNKPRTETRKLMNTHGVTAGMKMTPKEYQKYKKKQAKKT